jgi:hypothetical protein
LFFNNFFIDSILEVISNYPWQQCCTHISFVWEGGFLWLMHGTGKMFCSMHHNSSWFKIYSFLTKTTYLKYVDVVGFCKSDGIYSFVVTVFPTQLPI